MVMPKLTMLAVKNDASFLAGVKIQVGADILEIHFKDDNHVVKLPYVGSDRGAVRVKSLSCVSTRHSAKDGFDPKPSRFPRGRVSNLAGVEHVLDAWFKKACKHFEIPQQEVVGKKNVSCSEMHLQRV